MKLFVVPGWYMSPKKPQNGVFFREQALMLQQHGHEVVLLDCTERGRKDYFAKDNFHLVRKVEDGLLTYQLCYPNLFLTKTPRLKRLLARHRFKKLYRRTIRDNGEPDGIICHGFIMANNVITSNIVSSPIIVIEHSSYVLNKKLSAFQVEMLKEDISKSKSFLCVSRALKKSVVQLTGTQEDVIGVLENPVNNLFFEHDKIEKATQFRFVCVANINAESKGIRMLIEAFCRAFRKDDNVELIILGDGKDYLMMSNLVNQRERTEQIRMLGRVSRESVRDYLISSDVFILPSKYETFGVAYIEAMACGLPIISQKNGGSEQIITQECGILLDNPDEEDYVEAMKLIISNIGSYNKERIVELCRAQYSEEKYVARIEALLAKA